MDGKKCAIPSLHRDSFPAKHDHDLPGASSGNATSLYCRAVSKNAVGLGWMRVGGNFPALVPAVFKEA